MRDDYKTKGQLIQEVEGLRKQVGALEATLATERRQAGGELKESRNKYQRLEANIPGMVYLFESSIDGKHSFHYVTAASRELFGIEPEDIMHDGSLIQSIIHPDDKDRRDQSIKVSAETLQPWRQELRHIVNGEVRWFDCMSHPEKQPDGKVLWNGIMFDITERKRAEEKLLEISSRQEALLAAIPDIIMEVNAEKIYTWANQAGYDFFGKDVIGTEAGYYFEGDQNTYKKVQPIFNGKENVYYIESWQRRKDGQKRLLAWWCRALKDQNGEVIGALSSARDITESRQAEVQLFRSERALINPAINY
jgi:PAS domain S-box-containing protein